MIVLRSFGCQIQHRRKLRVQGKVRKQKKTLNSFAPAQTKVSLASPDPIVLALVTFPFRSHPTNREPEKGYEKTCFNLS
jgi:hypothetical protein